MDTAQSTSTPATFKQLSIHAIGTSGTAIQALRRSHFNQAKIAELAESIKTQGLLQPILVRPIPMTASDVASHEIVAGERRWLACKLAGLTHIDCHIRDLTDEQTLEAQLVENLQREDVSPLEEAEGYRELMKLKKIKAEDIGAMIGMSRAHVYARMKLLDLCPEARKLLDTGKIDASVALLVARLPNAELQTRAAKGCASVESAQDDEFYVDRDGDTPLTHNEAEQYIEETFAPLIKSLEIAEAAKKAGRSVLTGEAAAKVLDKYGRLSEHINLDEKEWFGNKEKTYRSIVGSPPEAILVQSKDGIIVDALPYDVVRRLLTEKKVELPYELKPRESGRISADMKPEDKEKIRREQRKKRLSVDIRIAQWKAVRAKYPPKLGKPELIELLQAIDGFFGKVPDGIDTGDDKALAKLNEKQLVGVVLDTLYGARLADDYRAEYSEKRMLAAAKRYKANTDKIKADLTAAFKAREAELAGNAKPAAKKAKK